MPRNPLRFLVLAALAALGALALSACGRSGGGASDADASATPRIVVLSPALGETLQALGLGESVVGRHAFDRGWPESVPAVGDQSGIDYERLLRLEPTHVLLEHSAAGTPPRLTQLAGANRFSVREFPMLTLGDIRGALEYIPAVFSSDNARERSRALLLELDAVLQPMKDIDDRAGRILLLYSTDPIGVAGPGSYHAEIVRALGMMLAVDTGRAYQVLDVEDARRLYPDSIVMFIPGADPSRKTELLGLLGTLDLRPVRSGRVAIINHPSAQIPGPGAIEVARQLREQVSSWPLLADVP